MKKVTTFVLSLIFAFSFAQENPKMERIKTLRIAFISNKLALTAEEAQKFWPIFNEFETKQTEIRKQRKQLNQKLKLNSENAVADKDYNQILADSENLDAEIQNNRRRFVKNLQGVIPTKKILILRQAEEEFKKKMLNQIRKRNMNKNR